jgi:hypothetical protein
VQIPENAKMAVNLTYFFGVAMVLLGGPPIYDGWPAYIAQWVLGTMLAAHVAEFLLVFVYFKLHQKLGTPMVEHFGPTLVHGLIHWYPLYEGANKAPAKKAQ